MDFEDQRVEVRGQLWSPPGQAILATHFRVEELRPTEPRVESPRELGAERELRGRFALHAWLAGTKLEGHSSPLFIEEDGTQHLLVAVPESLPEPGAPVLVRARPVELSPFVSRPEGPFLWIIAFRQDESPGWTEAVHRARGK